MGAACTHPEHDAYPSYGVGPHVCFHRRGPGFVPGQSLPVPESEWPANFKVDPETVDPTGQEAPLGVWSCPGCGGAGGEG